MAGASCRIELLPLSRLVPYGNPANYLSVIVEDFDRAGEDAWMIGGNSTSSGWGRGT
jgi:hypothetical protein